jgi:hypothetical protein
MAEEYRACPLGTIAEEGTSLIDVVGGEVEKELP